MVDFQSLYLTYKQRARLLFDIRRLYIHVQRRDWCVDPRSADFKRAPCARKAHAAAPPQPGYLCLQLQRCNCKSTPGMGCPLPPPQLLSALCRVPCAAAVPFFLSLGCVLAFPHGRSSVQFLFYCTYTGRSYIGAPARASQPLLQDL